MSIFLLVLSEPPPSPAIDLLRGDLKKLGMVTELSTGVWLLTALGDLSTVEMAVRQATGLRVVVAQLQTADAVTVIGVKP